MKSISLRATRARSRAERTLTAIHAAFHALAKQVHEERREQFFHETIELKQSELKARHIGRVVASEIVRLHQPHENTKSLFVGHLASAV